MALTRRHYEFDNFTIQASGAVIGGRFVKQTGTWADGGNIPAAHAGAGDLPIGVAGQDIASGAIGHVYGLDGVVGVEASGTLAQGAEVKVGAAGVAVTATSGTDFAIGRVLRGATTGNLALVYLYDQPTKTS